MGSLVTAVASYLDARSNRGEWLVRIEDLDPPREKLGAAAQILSDLCDHGLLWDGEVIFQSNRYRAYESALSYLIERHMVFKCGCSRKKLNDDGTCASKCSSRQDSLNENVALRFNNGIQADIKVNDFIFGEKIWHTRNIPKDFIIRRRDGLFSYQLAVVVDDASQGITHIIRGSDLLDSTPQQHEIASALNLSRLKYGHIPTITNKEGKKLSKQALAPSVDANQAAQNLRQALLLLGQLQPTASLETPSQILCSAIESWDRDAIPKKSSLPHVPLKI